MATVQLRGAKSGETKVLTEKACTKTDQHHLEPRSVFLCVGWGWRVSEAQELPRGDISSSKTLFTNIATQKSLTKPCWLIVNRMRDKDPSDFRLRASLLVKLLSGETIVAASTFHGNYSVLHIILPFSESFQLGNCNTTACPHFLSLTQPSNVQFKTYKAPSAADQFLYRLFS